MSPYTNSTVFADTNSNQHSIKIYSIVFFLNTFPQRTHSASSIVKSGKYS